MLTGELDKSCFNCNYCGMDMDMDPYCVHPNVLRSNPFGSNTNVVLGVVTGDEGRNLPHFGACKDRILFSPREVQKGVKRWPKAMVISSEDVEEQCILQDFLDNERERVKKVDGIPSDGALISCSCSRCNPGRL